VTGRPSSSEHLRDLARLRRVRDRIDREYAQPLDVEALARGAHMSAGHLSRQFRLAYGESPYAYLMTRRIERAMALLRRGDLSVTEVCFEVGCSSLGTFSTRFTELVGVPPSVYRRQAARDGGDAVLRGEIGDRTDQESRCASTEPRVDFSCWTELDMEEPAQEGMMGAKKTKGFTDEERAAMKERAKEQKAEAQKADGERAVLAKIAEMQGPDRAMAERLHEIIKSSVPALSPKTWYGMPAYAKDGKVVCFFQSAEKFNTRYATFSFSDKANLDEGAMWPTSFALKELTATEEAKIGALVKRAVS
jgi:AraC-like DNA-binding protein/uncharacterized protein YdhG (YjbR/CyaY superfamily)